MAAEGKGEWNVVPGVSVDVGSKMAAASCSGYLVVAPQTALHQGSGCWKASSTLLGVRYGAA
ncbi:Hypothetical predicted protein [Pelobates cultripes]|uniref:Uncharacterized protein n=1 Tax=Pelobates cultripes TaxID=61616 RepID=A0AAD1W2D2_PELCU|nr:Hypothetical predicted protein [Pelobates cultripes]